MSTLPFIGTAERRAAETVREFASKEENFWTPTGGKIPGNDPRHVLFLGDMRCVFSITRIGERRYRHMSVSIKGDHSEFPSPTLTEAAGQLFGFEGPMSEWFIAPDERHGRVILLQELL